MFGHYSYLVYTLIFTLSPIVLMWMHDYPMMRKNFSVIGIVALLSVLYQSIVDPFAESWHAWFFGNDKILGIWIGSFPIENTLFFALVSIAITSCILNRIASMERHREK